MGQVASVPFVLESHTERKCEVIPSVLPLHRVLVVADVSPRSHPPLSTPLRLSVRVQQRPHSMVVQRVWLHQVYYVEPVLLSGFRVTHLEIVPLAIPSCVIVRFQDKVVLELINLDSPSQVARLEAALKQ